MPTAILRTRYRVLAGAAIVLCLFAVRPIATETPGAAAEGEAVLTVNTASDSDNPDGFLSIREALMLASGELGGGLTPEEQAQTAGCVFNVVGDITGGCGAGRPDVIRFAESLGPIPEIRLGSPLPAISDTAATILDGGSARPVIHAGSAGAGADGISITSSDNTVRSLTVRNAPRDGIAISGSRNTISGVASRGNAASGVAVFGGTGNRVEASFLGLVGLNDSACAGGNGDHGLAISGGATGTIATGNVVGCNAGTGVMIDGAKDSAVRGNFIGQSASGARLANGTGLGLAGGATGNTAGGPAAADRNTIGGNTNEGVAIRGASTSGNTVEGNFIGLDPAGTAARPNRVGILVGEGAGTNTIRGNTISGNTREGVLIEGGGAGLVIAGNRIGTDALGVAAVANGLEGVVLQAGAKGVTVGGSAAADRNVISGNTGAGVVLRDAATTGNMIDGNYIGLDVGGAFAIGNGQAGVAIFGAPGNRIGTESTTARQFIGANGREGIYIEGAANTTVGRSTAVGLAASGAARIGNTREGILLSDVAGADIRPAAVVGSGLAGIALVGASSGGVLFPARVDANAGLPVDLGNNGTTANDTGDPDSGPNGLLNFPEITTRAAGTVSGTACSNCTVLLFNAFSNPAAGGARAEYVAQATAGAGGAWTATLPAGVPAANIAAIACTGSCGAGSSSSEMSPVTGVVQSRLVQFLVGLSRVPEGRSLEVQVILSSSDDDTSSGPVTVHYTTVPGTALAGSDFTAASGTISFLGGTKDGEVRSITIVTLADAADDAGERFTILLDASAGASLGPFSAHEITIGPPDSGRPFIAFAEMLSRD